MGRSYCWMLLVAVGPAATMPGHRQGQAPRNKGMRHPADPPTVEEIVLVVRHAAIARTACGCAG